MHKRKRVTRSHRVNKPPSHCPNCRSACKLGTRPSPPHGRARPVQPAASWTAGSTPPLRPKIRSPTTPAARASPEAGTEPIAHPRPATRYRHGQTRIASPNPSHFACGTADNGATPEPFACPMETMVRGLPGPSSTVITDTTDRESALLVPGSWWSSRHPPPASSLQESDLLSFTNIHGPVVRRANSCRTRR